MPAGRSRFSAAMASSMVVLKAFSATPFANSCKKNKKITFDHFSKGTVVKMLQWLTV
jgi:hypothetical protein